MTLIKITGDELEKEMKGEVMIENDRCVITQDFENSNIIYVYDSKTNSLIYTFDEHGQFLDYFKVYANGKAGIFLISECRMHIPAIYRDIDVSAFIHHEKKGPFFAQLENTKYIVLDFNGKSLNNEEYDKYETFVDGLAVVAKLINGQLKYGIIKCDGTSFFPCNFNKIYWEGCRIIGKIQTPEGIKYFCKDTIRLFDKADKIFQTSRYKKDYEIKYVLEDFSTREKYIYISKS